MLRRLILGLALLAPAAAAEAKGIKLVQGFPDFTSVDTSIHYDADVNVFKVVGIGVTYRTSLRADPDDFLAAEYMLTAEIDEHGAFTPGGSLSIFDTESSKTLLAGTLKDFSLDDTVFNFLFEVDEEGGEMMADFGGKGAMGGVIITAFNVGKIDFKDSFDVGELNTQVDTFAAVPEPSTIMSTGLGMAMGLGGLGLRALSRRRKCKA